MDVRSKSGHTEECKADKRHKISQYLEKCDREHLYLRPESVFSSHFGSCTDFEGLRAPKKSSPIWRINPSRVIVHMVDDGRCLARRDPTAARDVHCKQNQDHGVVSTT